MRKVLSLALTFLLLILSSPAFAEDSFWSDDSSPQGQVGLLWYEDVLRSGNGISAITASDSSGNGAICNSLTDSHCEQFQVKSVEVILPVCSSGSYEICVNGLAISSNGGDKVKGQFVRNIAGNTVPKDVANGIPFGSTIGLWKVPGQLHTGGLDTYAVAARIRYTYSNGKLNLRDFEASVVPYREVESDEGRLMEYKVIDEGSRTALVYYYHVGRCIWQEVGHCGVATRWSEGANVSLSLKVPNDVTGWLQGRLREPQISVTPITSHVNEISITAKPVSVQGSAPKVNIDSIPDPLLKVLTDDGSHPLQAGGGYVWQLTPNISNLKWFNAWLPFTRDRADGFSDYWNFKSMPENFSTSTELKCLTSTSKLVGLVTTNSLIFSGNPPTFQNQQLTYKLAALHFNPDGKTQFVGTYDLLVDSKAARCLYGFTSAPIQAAISITSSDGVDQVSTFNLHESGGWLRLSANGFSFSSPTIKIKLTQKSTGVVNSIICISGRKKVTIVGKYAKCPKGYARS